MLPHLIRYKRGVFPFQNNHKALDPSCQMDLGLWDCFGREKPLSYNERTMVYVSICVFEERRKRCVIIHMSKQTFEHNNDM